MSDDHDDATPEPVAEEGPLPTRHQSTTTSDRVRRASRPSNEALEAVENDLLEELSKVFHEPDVATLAASRAGFPREHLPSFQMPLTFWHGVLRELHNGRTVGGVGALVDEAVRLFPANEVFTSYRERYQRAVVAKNEGIIAAIDHVAVDQRVFDEMDEWLGTRSSGWLLLTGKAGAGKSVLSVQWLRHCENQGIPTASHVIRDNGDSWSDPQVVQTNLASQVEQMFPEQRDAEAPAPRLAQLLERLSPILIERDERLVLLVDGLDDASGRDPLASILPLELPPRIFVVLTLRNGSPHLRSLRRRPNTKRIPLDGRLTPTNVAPAQGRSGPLDTTTKLQREAKEAELVLEVRKTGASIATILADSEGELCFALYGPWGRGKTTLARVICTNLDTPRSGRPRYAYAWFNAWKYRSPPEIWAHLYQCVAQASSSRGFLAQFAHTIRANVLRMGLWPLTLALFSLAFGLVPMSMKIESAEWLIGGFASVLGILGAIWFLLALRTTTGVMNRVWKLYGALPGHRDKLGLQATIGDDLRHLLCGWIWKHRGRPDDPRTTASPTDAPSPKPGRLDTALLAIGVLLVGGVLFFVLRSKSSSLLMFSIPSAIWLMAWGTCAWLVVRGGRGIDRVLLVVDDLDRCPPDLMLEVLESIKLLVEEPEIRERLQVLVLVDDEMLLHVVANRFQPYVERLPESERAKLRRRLVREHLDKIFLGDFRLGRLSTHQVEALVNKFIDVSNAMSATSSASTSKQAPKEAPKPKVALPSLPTGEDEPNTPVPPSSTQAQQSNGSGAAEVPTHVKPFTDDERDILVEYCCELLLDEGSGHRLGPRLIRSMLLRYQLARLLLHDQQTREEPLVIADRIIAAVLGTRETPLDPSSPAQVIIDQVAGIDTSGLHA